MQEPCEVKKAIIKNNFEFGLFSKSYCIMNRLPGDDLDKAVSKFMHMSKPSTVQMVGNVIVPLLEAYQKQISEKGYVHRDIKPANILAKFEVNQSAIHFLDTDTSLMVNDLDTAYGAAGYLPPEILSLLVSDELTNEEAILRVSTKRDIFQLGVVLIGCLNPELQPITYLANFTFTDATDAICYALQEVIENQCYDPDYMLNKISSSRNDVFKYIRGDVVVPEHERNEIKSLLKEMTAFEPEMRPDIDQVIARFEEIQRKLLVQDKEQEKYKESVLSSSKLVTTLDLNEKSAVIIQKNFRRFIAKKKYRIDSLTEKNKTFFSTYVIGNDPVMPSSLTNYTELHDKIALIATSGMRAVSLACTLGNEKNIPKIILIDDSKKVCGFWRAIRSFVENDDQAATSDLFLINLNSFLAKHAHLYSNFADDVSEKINNGVKYHNQNIHTYFSDLINKHGYDYIRSVIMHTSFIQQSWADQDTFVKIKNILNYLKIDKIYMYPSNILACIQDENTRNQVLDNIKNMAPMLSIHTDRCDRHCLPENVYLFENQDQQYVKKSIFSSDLCHFSNIFTSSSPVNEALSNATKVDSESFQFAVPVHDVSYGL